MTNDLDVDSPEVARFLAELGALPETCDPTPSAELAELLESGVPAAAAPVRSVRRPVAAVSATVLVAALSGTGWAAAANELPGPVQDALSQLSRHLPFDVPPSSERDPGPDTERHARPVDQPTRTHRSRAARADERRGGEDAGTAQPEDVSETTTVPATTDGGDVEADHHGTDGGRSAGDHDHMATSTGADGDRDDDDRADDDRADDDASDDDSGHEGDGSDDVDESDDGSSGSGSGGADGGDPESDD